MPQIPLASRSKLDATRATERILRYMESPSSLVGIARLSATKYRLYQQLEGENYWRIDLAQLAGLPGGLNCHMLSEATIDMPWLSVDQTDGSVVHTGAGWSGPTAQAAAFGGSYMQNNTGTGQDVTWTTPADVTRVGVRTVAAANGGIIKVEIDGNATLANLLPTAQELVTRGQLAATALVANGGTLNPTDRVLDLYSAASTPANTIDYDRHFGLAEGLPEGAHVVKLTVTGYQNVAASGFRLYSSGFTYGKLDTSIDTANIELLTHTRLMANEQSAYEFAHEFLPDAGGAYAFIGNVHGYESQSELAIYVDGASVTLADGDRIMGNQVAIRRTSTLRHPNVGAGAATVADVVTTYRLNRSGLLIAHRTAWAVAGTLRKSYSAMLPLDGRIFDRASMADADSDFALTDNNGTIKGQVRSDTGYLWDGGGRFMALMHCPDLPASVNDWANAAPVFLGVEDRTPADVNKGDLSKMYLSRVNSDSPLPVTNATVHRSRSLYRLSRAVDADQLLSRT